MTTVTPSPNSRALVLCVAALLSACSTARYQGDEGSPYYVIPTGTRVVLKQALTIPPEQVGVYIQNGKVLPWPEVNAYYAHCKFELRDRKDTEQNVNPDEFIVTRVVQDVVHMVNWGRWQTAGVSMGIRVGDMDGGASVRTYATYIYLGSDRQPRVFRLGCGHWAYPGTRYAEHLSIAQMRKALGDLVTLELPAKGP
jgi:hypothetical protein